MRVIETVIGSGEYIGKRRNIEVGTRDSSN